MYEHRNIFYDIPNGFFKKLDNEYCYDLLENTVRSQFVILPNPGSNSIQIPKKSLFQDRWSQKSFISLSSSEQDPLEVHVNINQKLK